MHGRNDDRAPISFSSRLHVGLNNLQDGARSRLGYIEATNAEHFGTDLPGFDTRMVPLPLYHLRALDMMWITYHLTKDAPLHESQVLHHAARRGGRARAAIAVEQRPADPAHVAPRGPHQRENGHVTIP